MNISVLRQLFLSSCVAAASAADAQTWNAAADFSNTVNPSGPWFYTQSPSLLGTRTLLSGPTVYQGIDFWGFRADVAKNNTGSHVILDGVVSMNPGQLTLHPGSNGEYSVLRFLSPSTQTYNITSIFEACDTVGTGGVDVHLLLNGVSLLDANLTTLTSTSDVRSLTLSAGDLLEYVVGYGADLSYNGDSVSVTANLQAVPEPGTMAALGFGVLGLLKRRKRV